MPLSFSAATISEGLLNVSRASLTTADLLTFVFRLAIMCAFAVEPRLFVLGNQIKCSSQNFSI